MNDFTCMLKVKNSWETMPTYISMSALQFHITFATYFLFPIYNGLLLKHFIFHCLSKIPEFLQFLLIWLLQVFSVSQPWHFSSSNSTFTYMSNGAMSCLPWSFAWWKTGGPQSWCPGGPPRHLPGRRGRIVSASFLFNNYFLKIRLLLCLLPNGLKWNASMCSTSHESYTP